MSTDHGTGYLTSCSGNNSPTSPYFSSCSRNKGPTLRYFSSCTINKGPSSRYFSSRSGTQKLEIEPALINAIIMTDLELRLGGRVGDKDDDVSYFVRLLERFPLEKHRTILTRQQDKFHI